MGRGQGSEVRGKGVWAGGEVRGKRVWGGEGGVGMERGKGCGDKG